MNFDMTAAIASPYSHLLESNFVPSPLVRAEISNILVDHKQNLRGLDADVARLEDILASHKQKRDALHHRVNSYERLLSPFRALPDDMLREIFLWCIPADYNAVMSVVEAPLLLGRVCSRWRQIAYRTPRLWASLHIPNPNPPVFTNSHPHLAEKFRKVWEEFDAKLALYTSEIDKWLQRSGTCGLSLSWHPREAAPLHYEKYVKLYLDILLKYTHRWQSVQFTVSAGESSTALATIPAQSLPKLTHVDLKFTRRMPHDRRWGSCGLLSASRLYSLQLISLPVVIATINIEWWCLTKLAIHDVYAHRTINILDAHSLLSRCPNLKHCMIKILDLQDVKSPNEPIHLRYLESLSIIEGAPNIESLFEQLTLPSLHTIAYHTQATPSARQPLLTLISRSSKPIVKLVTDILVFSLADILALFDATPSLVHFINRRSTLGYTREQTRIRGSIPVGAHFIKVFINLLTPGYLETCPWPKLRRFEVKDVVMMSDEDVLNMIVCRMESSTSRTWTTLEPGDPASSSTSSEVDSGPNSSVVDIAPLQLFRISFHAATPVGILPRLEQYIKRGFKANINYPAFRAVAPGTFPCRSGLPPKGANQTLDQLIDALLYG